MAGTIVVFAAAAALFFLSLVIGSIPSYFRVNKAGLSLLGALGGGILIGSTLAVIIPEGIETLYTTAKIPIDGGGAEEATGVKYGFIVSKDLHKFIGPCLLGGYMLMAILDYFTTSLQASASSSQRPSHVSVSELNDLRSSSSDNLGTGASVSAHVWSMANLKQSLQSPTLVGMAIHGLADGVALGAGFSSSSAGLEMIIFMAIVLHKSPAAIGLSALLMSDGFGARQVRLPLALFCATSPASMVVTYLAIRVFGSATSGNTGLDFITSLAILFSGGTMLYVASNLAHHESRSLVSFTLTVIGVLIPVVLSTLAHVG